MIINIYSNNKLINTWIYIKDDFNNSKNGNYYILLKL